MTDITECPKCGFQEPQKDECPRCGIVFSKLVKQHERDGERAAPRAAVPSPGTVRAEPKRRPVWLLVLLIPMALAVYAQSRASSHATGSEGLKDGDWLRDSDGYWTAVQTGLEDSRLVTLYVYTDWCPHCREVERGLLSADAVGDCLSGTLRIRLNPERSPAERAVSDLFEVTGYPALFMHDPRSGESLKLLTHTLGDNGAPRLFTPDEFVEGCRLAIELLSVARDGVPGPSARRRAATAPAGRSSRR